MRFPWLTGLALWALLTAVFLACSAAQEPIIEAATCSPKADAWFATTLVTTCKGKPTSECPEADALTEEYLKRESEECGP